MKDPLMISIAHPSEAQAPDAHEDLYLELANVFINVKNYEWNDFLATLPDEPSIGLYFKNVLLEFKAKLDSTADKYAEMHGLIMDIDPDSVVTTEVHLEDIKPLVVDGLSKAQQDYEFIQRMPNKIFTTVKTDRIVDPIPDVKTWRDEDKK